MLVAGALPTPFVAIIRGSMQNEVPRGSDPALLPTETNAVPPADIHGAGQPHSPHAAI